MNQYKLSNIIVKDLKSKGFKSSEIRKMKCNKKYFKDLIYNNNIVELSCRQYCCYGEDINCWLDIEAPRCGWLWLRKTTKDTIEEIRKMFLSNVKEFNKNNSGKNIFIAENKDFIYIVLPMRIIASEDVWLILKK